MEEINTWQLVYYSLNDSHGLNKKFTIWIEYSKYILVSEINPDVWTVFIFVSFLSLFPHFLFHKRPFLKLWCQTDWDDLRHQHMQEPLPRLCSISYSQFLQDTFCAIPLQSFFGDLHIVFTKADRRPCLTPARVPVFLWRWRQMFVRSFHLLNLQLKTQQCSSWHFNSCSSVMTNMQIIWMWSPASKESYTGGF